MPRTFINTQLSTKHVFQGIEYNGEIKRVYQYTLYSGITAAAIIVYLLLCKRILSYFNFTDLLLSPTQQSYINARDFLGTEYSYTNDEFKMY